MKKEIHPKYFPNSHATCACGAKHVVGSTMEKIGVEICSSCHPFYTGADKLMDTAGRVEKFKQRRAKSDSAKSGKDRSGAVIKKS
ncbi:MAG: 50S ribosomal protein L31 [Candidatus Taylorbacteria bacterium RIFCSPLOWO2_12_FULL_47_20]|uniref:Large ribosomal subunit protein bL31 n=2 Tax=Candidatus Tayloriibacteriota TaxID=1817919 RepID=A0A1G2P534_9BACT|nr:MAG: 50S ribosomal protein L31 [Candidatus Taylorbacteria bacterium RIFCSPLOWO2_02_FULL_46_40]OHA43465.1 MAG: 50S ribosomal protein L31 [Candidatus Taylorbacteria bacterium RIFCSPLOWO2_12_FULL_47_20]